MDSDMLPISYKRFLVFVFVFFSLSPFVISKIHMETYIIVFKIDSQWEFAVCLRKPKQGLCINLEG